LEISKIKIGRKITPGHEFSGEIIKAGEKAFDEKGERFKEGDIVTVEEMHWCGICKACRMVIQIIV